MTTTMTVVNGLVLNATITLESTISPSVRYKSDFQRQWRAPSRLPPPALPAGELVFSYGAAQVGIYDQVTVTGNSNSNAALTIGQNVEIDGETGTIVAGNSAHPGDYQRRTIASDNTDGTNPNTTINDLTGRAALTMLPKGTLAASNGNTLTMHPGHMEQRTARSM